MTKLPALRTGNAERELPPLFDFTRVRQTTHCFWMQASFSARAGYQALTQFVADPASLLPRVKRGRQRRLGRYSPAQQQCRADEPRPVELILIKPPKTKKQTWNILYPSPPKNITKECDMFKDNTYRSNTQPFKKLSDPNNPKLSKFYLCPSLRPKVFLSLKRDPKVWLPQLL